MRKYRIRVIETLSRTVEVEADDYESAYGQVEKLVDEGKIILTDGDFESREFYPLDHGDENK